MGERLRLFLPLILFAVLAGLLYLGLGRDPRTLPSALLDRPVPAFRLIRLADGQLQDETVLHGEARLLNVWGTWCAACRDEHPYLVQLAQQGVSIVGLNYKDDPGRAREWLQQLGDPYELVLVDADGRFGLELGIYGDYFALNINYRLQEITEQMARHGLKIGNRCHFFQDFHTEGSFLEL